MNLFVILLFASLVEFANGQVLLRSHGGEPLLRVGDAPLFDEHSSRSDMACTLVPVQPKLDFDFLFHTGFRVSIPSKDLEMDTFGNELTTIFRVVPQDPPQAPVYMYMKVRIPPGHGMEKGNLEFDEVFRLGEGKYHVDWIMRDRVEHACTSSWDVTASFGSKDERLRAWTQPQTVLPVENEMFKDAMPVPREAGALRVDVLVNLGPHDPASASLEENDVQSVVSILRQIANDRNIGSFSLVACSIPGHKVLHEQRASDVIDFPGMGEAIKSLKLGTVDAKDLKFRAADFTADAVKKLSAESASDVLIVVGPRMVPDSDGVDKLAAALRDLNRPVIYLNYRPDKMANPWRDMIGKAVKQAHGSEYEIVTPRDLFNAWVDVVPKIYASKRVKAPGSTTFQLRSR